MLYSLLLILAGAWLGLAALLFVFQSRFVYFPDAVLVQTPAAAGLAYEDVYLETADGVRLHGWFVPVRRPRATLLFLHGNAGNISHRLESLRIFHRLGLATLIIDYRGFGHSGGTPGEQGTYRDADAAWHYLIAERGLAPAEIVIFGRSLGGAVAARLAARVQPAALIVESSFTSVPDLAAKLYPYLPVRWLARFDYDTEARLRGVRCPVLVVHSRDDEIIPFAHGRALYEAAPPPRALLVLRGGHNEGFVVSGEDYVRGLGGFLDAHLPPAAAAPPRHGPRPGPAPL